MKKLLLIAAIGLLVLPGMAAAEPFEFDIPLILYADDSGRTIDYELDDEPYSDSYPVHMNWEMTADGVVTFSDDALTGFSENSEIVWAPSGVWEPVRERGGSYTQIEDGVFSFSVAGLEDYFENYANSAKYAIGGVCEAEFSINLGWGFVLTNFSNISDLFQYRIDVGLGSRQPQYNDGTSVYSPRICIYWEKTGDSYTLKLQAELTTDATTWSSEVVEIPGCDPVATFISATMIVTNGNQLLIEYSIGEEPQTLWDVTVSEADMRAMGGPDTLLPYVGVTIKRNAIYPRGCDCSRTDITGVPQTECEALLALYQSTSIHDFSYNYWNTELKIDLWEGVTVTDGHVTEINLSDKEEDLTGTVPSEIGNLIHLENLYLNNNQLSGSIPVGIGNLNNLKSLRLEKNQLSGHIPPELGNLHNLECLGLWQNQLSGTIPPELGSLSNLYDLALDENQLTGSIPVEIWNLENLYYLYLSGNQLEGPISPEIGNLTNLEWLWLQDNQLSGKIPSEIGNLSSLYELCLHENQLCGFIPPEIGNLTQMTWLNLRDNQLSGSIPPEIGHLTSLEYLALCNNQLSGAIPSEIGSLSNLYTLRLNDNLFSGEIPVEMKNLNAMNVLDLEEFDGLNIRNNCLIASDSELLAFLNEKDADWQKYQCFVKGDIDASGGDPNMADLILALKILNGMDMTNTYIRPASDVNGDSKIGLPEAVYILQIISEIRDGS